MTVYQELQKLRETLQPLASTDHDRYYIYYLKTDDFTAVYKLTYMDGYLAALEHIETTLLKQHTK
jgi:hypothetical protein